MSEKTKEGLSRRNFLGLAGLATAGVAASIAHPNAAFATEDGRVGDWARDGSETVDVPNSRGGNASSDDGTYREHTASAFPADDATPIPPRSVPASWDYECDIVVVGAGGGGLNAAARSIELGAQTICVEAAGLWGGNAQSAGMCAILGGSRLQEDKRFAFPTYPFDAQKMTDWAMDEYHFAADPKLIYRIAEGGGKCIDWMADCGVEWRLGEVPLFGPPPKYTHDQHGPEAQCVHRIAGCLQDSQGVHPLPGQLQGCLQSPLDVIGACSLVQLADTHVHCEVNLQLFPAFLAGLNVF